MGERFKFEIVLTTVTLIIASFLQVESFEGLKRSGGNDERRFYKAAVVEYEADTHNAGLTSEQILFQNVDSYERIIRQASEESTDIIVFPEYGLTTLLAFSEAQLQFIPEVGSHPCDDHTAKLSKVIHQLSCAAKAGGIYVVINLGEIANCDEKKKNSEFGYCTTNESRKYNTAVVFGRDGHIVAKYRKTHLFAEPQFTAPEVPSASTFTTDFGVEIGVFVCFDILFEFPAKELVRRGVRHFVFPTAWIDELPFLTAVQTQMFWASSSKVTLLGAGYHLPKFGKLGSGIFLPNGQSLNYTADPESGTRVIYGQVPIHNDQIQEQGHTSSGNLESKGTTNTQENLKDREKVKRQMKSRPFGEIEERFYYREDLKNYTGVTLPLSFDGEQTVSLCDKDFCCEVTYKHRYNQMSMLSNSDANEIEKIGGNSNLVIPTSLNYKLVVFNQTRKFSSPSVVKTMHLQICSIVRCLDESIQSCAEAGDQLQKNFLSNKITQTASEGAELLPNFEALKLHSSTFMSQQKQKSSQESNPVKGEADASGYTRPGFNTLDLNFNLIPAPLFDFEYTTPKTSQMLTVTLSSNKIRDFSVQTLALIHRIF